MNYPNESAAMAAFDANRCTYWHPERDGEPQSRCSAPASADDRVGDRCVRHARPAVNIEATGLELLAQRLAFKLHGCRTDGGQPIDYLYADDARTIVEAERATPLHQILDCISALPVARITAPSTPSQAATFLESVASELHQLRMDRASLLEDLDASVSALRASGLQVADRAPLRFEVRRLAEALADISLSTETHTAPDGSAFLGVKTMDATSYVSVAPATVDLLREFARGEG